MSHVSCSFVCFVFFFNDTATTEISTLSLHDALPISEDGIRDESVTGVQTCALPIDRKSTRLNSSHISYAVSLDRKSTRLNSSHTLISYAVFCLKKKKYTQKQRLTKPRGGPATPDMPMAQFT